MKTIKKSLQHSNDLIGRKLLLNRSIKAKDISGKFNLQLHAGNIFKLVGYNDDDLLVAAGVKDDKTGKVQQMVAVIRHRNKFSVLPEHREIQVAARAVIKKDGLILCGLRKKDRYNGGMWEIPGGRKEDSETIEAALMRECSEELGVVAVPDNEIFSCKEFGLDFIIDHHFFITNIVGNEPKPNDHEELRWLSIRNLIGMKLVPSLDQLVRAGIDI